MAGGWICFIQIMRFILWLNVTEENYVGYVKTSKVKPEMKKAKTWSGSCMG